MSSAREIIAISLGSTAYPRFDRADGLLKDLAKPGFRILAHDEPDPATVERCAQIVAARGPATQDMTSTMICEALDEAAAELRTLTGGKS